VLLELTPDQDFLRETTARFLSSQVPVDEIRRLRRRPDGFDRDYWRRGADLGWTSLLVAEDQGGGSVSGHGLIDLTLIAHEFGRHAAPGPLTPCNVVAAALSASGGHPDVVDGLLSGHLTASWSLEEHGRRDPLDGIGVLARIDGDEVVLTGVKRPVEAAASADFMLVTARTGDGLTQVLVPSGTPGVTVRPMQSVDLTRRFSVVDFADVRVPLESVVGDAGRARHLVDRQFQLALVILNAEMVGAMERAFDMTVDWAFDRYSFGRPLASYQELKHRFADMKSWLEAAHAIADAAAVAVDSEAADATELVSIAKAFIGEYGIELVQDCVQLHGGIGVTFDHDLHLFLRRATLDRSLYGTPAAHRQRVARLAEMEMAGDAETAREKEMVRA
jgi:alkylation response protein AidB-like acyl-CoA dehydrogenase